MFLVLVNGTICSPVMQAKNLLPNLPWLIYQQSLWILSISQIHLVLSLSTSTTEYLRPMWKKKTNIFEEHNFFKQMKWQIMSMDGKINIA